MTQRFLHFSSTLNRVSSTIDAIQDTFAQGLKWLILLMTLMVCTVIVLRFFNIGAIALQESIGYMHAMVFMLCMAYTAKAGGHVRVDIFYRRFALPNQAWVNLIGHCVFLLPFALFLTLVTWQHAAQSWLILESSNSPGGLPLVFILKSLAPAAGILLSLQALSDICRQLLAVSFGNSETQ